MHRTILTLFIAGLAISANVSAQPTARSLIFAGDASPLGDVPGRPGLVFSESASVASLAVSPDGGAWAALWTVFDGPDILSSIVSGDHNAIDYVWVQNDLFPGLGYTVDRRPDESISINNAGQFSATVVALGGTTQDRQRIVRYNPGTGEYDELARGGGTITGLGASIPGAEGERYPSAAFTSGTSLNDGRIAISARGTRSILPSDQDELLLLTGVRPGDDVSLVVQAGVLVPSSQSGGAADVLTDIDDEVYFTGDGSSSILTGSLARGPGLTEVVVVDGQAVYEVGLTIPGLTGTTVAQPNAQMFEGGNWLYFGSTNTGDSYLVANGQVAWKSGDAVPGGTPGETVTSIRGGSFNEAGDLLIDAVTSDNRFILLLSPVDGASRTYLTDETPFDIDGDGIPDDAFFNGVTQGTRFFLTENRDLFYIGRLKDAFEFNIADGLHFVDFQEQDCLADINGDGTLTPADFNAWVLAFNAQASGCDQNEDGLCDPGDFNAWVLNFNAGCG